MQNSEKPQKVREISKTSLREIKSCLSVEKLKECVIFHEYFRIDYFPPKRGAERLKPQFRFTNPPIFFTGMLLRLMSGNYHKFSRAISQSEWIIHGSKLFDSSVDEIVIRPLVQNGIVKASGN